MDGDLRHGQCSGDAVETSKEQPQCRDRRGDPVGQIFAGDVRDSRPVTLAVQLSMSSCHTCVGLLVRPRIGRRRLEGTCDDSEARAYLRSCGAASKAAPRLPLAA